MGRDGSSTRGSRREASGAVAASAVHSVLARLAGGSHAGWIFS